MTKLNPPDPNVQYCDGLGICLKRAAYTPPAGERFLLAYVSQDTKIIGIEHDTEADWLEVQRAHEALRDRLNVRLSERDKCPVKPRDTVQADDVTQAAHKLIAELNAHAKELPAGFDLGTIRNLWNALALKEPS